MKYISVDGKTYHVRIESHTVFCYYLHEDWCSVVFEQVSTYDVNGVKGYGIFEFLYRFVISFLSLSFWSAFFTFDLLCSIKAIVATYILELGFRFGSLQLNFLRAFVLRQCLLLTKFCTEIS